MQEKIIQENILGILENITEIIRHLTQSQPPYSQLEIDYLMEQIRHLYEEVHYLNKFNQKLVETSTRSVEAIPQSFDKKEMETPTAQEEKPSPSTSSIPPSNLEKDTVQTPSNITINHPLNEAQKKEEKLTSWQDTKNQQSSKNESQILADKYIGTYKTLYEQYSERAKETTTTYEKPIKNLKTEIALNDKFRFVQTIFNGNIQEYEQFISKLEESADFHQASTLAEAIFQKKAEKISDDIKQLFLNYLKRRFKI